MHTEKCLSELLSNRLRIREYDLHTRREVRRSIEIKKKQFPSVPVLYFFPSKSLSFANALLRRDGIGGIKGCRFMWIHDS
jgi:hypothetical protein